MFSVPPWCFLFSFWVPAFSPRYVHSWLIYELSEELKFVRSDAVRRSLSACPSLSRPYGRTTNAPHFGFRIHFHPSSFSSDGVVADEAGNRITLLTLQYSQFAILNSQFSPPPFYSFFPFYSASQKYVSIGALDTCDIA